MLPSNERRPPGDVGRGDEARAFLGEQLAEPPEAWCCCAWAIAILAAAAVGAMVFSGRCSELDDCGCGDECLPPGERLGELCPSTWPEAPPNISAYPWLFDVRGVPSPPAVTGTSLAAAWSSIFLLKRGCFGSSRTSCTHGASLLLSARDTLQSGCEALSSRLPLPPCMGVVSGVLSDVGSQGSTHSVSLFCAVTLRTRRPSAARTAPEARLCLVS
mmetsp:Transcript_80168/g.208334  ORF Transcript_80168/g.208334 Transcript_80168/m.208334 type:complete len:216 (+) Transcript_80168:551-1198(+)